MLEDSLEQGFSGIRLSRSVRIDDSKNKQHASVQVPLMVRLSREGTVALGDVYSPCVALGSIALAGRPATTLDILVLGANGDVAAVTCRMQGKGVHADGAKTLKTVLRKLKALKTFNSLDTLYKKTYGKSHPGESILDIALGHWEGATEGTIKRLRDRWADNLVNGRIALYLATERKPDDKPSKKTDPITPMQKLLTDRAGGVVQVQTEIPSPRPHAKYIEGLEEPARLIWVYRRMKTS